MITVNPRLFTKFGEDYRLGKFTKLPRDSYEYIRLWEEQLNYCVNGISIGGMKISGSLYTYINFGTITIGDEDRPKSLGTPVFRDIELEIDRRFWEAKSNGKDLLIVSGRRTGKTSYGSFLPAWSSTLLGTNTENLIGAADSRYTHGAMTMCKRHITGFIGTEIGKPIHSSNFGDDGSGSIVLGWKYKDPETNQYIEKEAGVIHGVNFATNSDAADGKSGWIVLLDEIGKFPNLIAVRGSVFPTTMIGGNKYGTMLYMGTGKDMEKGSLAASQMFYAPEAYNLLTFHDEATPEKKTAWFIPGWISYDELRDDFGNIDKQKAIDKVIVSRKDLEKGTVENARAAIKAVPLNVDEIFQNKASHFFNIEELQDELIKLRTSPGYAPPKEKVRLIWNKDKVEIIPAEFDEVAHPVDSNKSVEGGIILYERPILINGSIPNNLYLGGTDPFHFDKEINVESLGSTFIYKRGIGSDEGGNVVVAEYTGRPKTVDEYFENTRKLLYLYNAIDLHERSSLGMKSYFERTKSLSRLAPVPKIIATKLMYDWDALKGYGLDIKTLKAKLYAIERLANSLRTVDPDKPRIQKLNSEWLVQELISFNLDGNFDRVAAFALCIIYDEELYNVTVDAISSNKPDPFYQDTFNRLFGDAIQG